VQIETKKKKKNKRIIHCFLSFCVPNKFGTDEFIVNELHGNFKSVIEAKIYVAKVF
jgi:hypothetical protein